MPLSKYPIEIPLGGAVDEGNVPEIVQPPRIREASNCVSIKGGAYSKKDATDATVAVPAGTFEVEHTGQETVCFQPQTVGVLSDGAVSTPEVTPAGSGEREVRAVRVAEADAVKQHGDHASLVLPDGRVRTLCLWNTDALSAPQTVTARSGAGVTHAALFKEGGSSAVNSGFSYYPTGGVRGCLLDDGVRVGIEISTGPVPDRLSFPRVRAYEDAGTQKFVTSLNEMTLQLKLTPALGSGPAPDTYGAHLDSWAFGNKTAPPPIEDAEYGRDILNEYASLPTPPPLCSPTGTPRGVVQCRDVDGVVTGQAFFDDIGDPLPPIMEMVVASNGTVYTLHIRNPAGALANATDAVINAWDVSGAVPVPLGPPVIKQRDPVSDPGVVPCGLHDTGSPTELLLLVWSDTSFRRIQYSLVDAPGALQSPFWEVGFPSGLFFSRYGDLSIRAVVEDSTIPEGAKDAYRLSRGCWPGSFLAPLEDGTFWLGVQVMCDLDDNDLGRTGIGTPREPLDFSSPDFPESAIPHPCSVVHRVLNANAVGEPETAGIIPGASILSQGALVGGVGPCVALLATSTGDDRTAVQWKTGSTFTDAISPTCFLVTRTQQQALRVSPEGYPEVGAVGWSPDNQAIAVAQVLPLGSCIGSTMVNPYQVRQNLDVGEWGVRWMGFERAGIIEEPTGTDPPTGGEEIEIRTGAAALSSVTLFSMRPAPTQTARAGDYALVDGAMPTTVGSSRALASGSGLQCVIDAILRAPNVPIFGTFFGGVDLRSSVDSGDGLNVAAYGASFDAVGGEHRSVPYQVTGGYRSRAGNGANYTEALIRAYPFPWQLLGLPYSTYFQAPLYTGTVLQVVSQQTGNTQPPLVTHEMFEYFNPRLNGVRVAADPARFGYCTDGDGSGLYTAGGELAADAPSPAAAIATVNNRVWMVSSVDPRTAQYTKVLRRGYAPEWNANLTVRVPDTELPLTAIGALPDGRVLLFSPTSIYYTYGDGPSDTGQGAGFAEPALLADTVGCADKRSIAVGDFGCIFRGDRGFYLVDRQLALTYVGLPYEDSTAAGDVVATSTDGLRSEVIFYVAPPPGEAQQRWVYNYLRQQWSTFIGEEEAIAATERGARPLALAAGALEFPEETPAPLTALAPPFEQAMSLTTGWLAMGKIQGYGRTWEVQLTGIRGPGSLSGLRVEIYYDYTDTPFETYDFDDVGSGQFKVRFRPRKQKSEAISFRFSEYVPTAVAPDDCTGWRLDMCTVLAGVKAGLDKVAVTVRSS